MEIYTNRNKIINSSGSVACKATRNGDAFPHDSIGTSINLTNIGKLNLVSYYNIISTLLHLAGFMVFIDFHW